MDLNRVICMLIMSFAYELVDGESTDLPSGKKGL